MCRAFELLLWADGTTDGTGSLEKNSVMENFFGILKQEEVYLRHYKNFYDAKSSLSLYIEGFYNRNRIYSAIGYLTPHQFEKSFVC